MNLEKRTDTRQLTRRRGRGQESRASPRHADLVPLAAVEIEFVAVSLARAAVADIGVHGMPVIGCLPTTVRSFDGAELARHARPGLPLDRNGLYFRAGRHE